MALFQVRGQPGDAEIKDHAVRHIHDAHREHVPIAKEASPILPPACMTDVGRPFGDDGLKFRFADRAMLRWLVAEPGVPDRDPYETDRSEGHEDGSPRH